VIGKHFIRSKYKIYSLGQMRKNEIAGQAIMAMVLARATQCHITEDSILQCCCLYLQRLGSVRGEDVPYVLGLPLVGGQPFFPHNYTRQDGSVSRLLIHYLSNFARKGCAEFCDLF
jgi:hypothetical protein